MKFCMIHTCTIIIKNWSEKNLILKLKCELHQRIHNTVWFLSINRPLVSQELAILAFSHQMAVCNKMKIKHKQLVSSLCSRFTSFDMSSYKFSLSFSLVFFWYVFFCVCVCVCFFFFLWFFFFFLVLLGWGFSVCFLNNKTH